jgi:hypothetical protein
MTDPKFQHMRPVAAHELICPWCGGSFEDEDSPAGRMHMLTAPSLDHIQYVHDDCKEQHGMPKPGRRWSRNA